MILEALHKLISNLKNMSTRATLVQGCQPNHGSSTGCSDFLLASKFINQSTLSNSKCFKKAFAEISPSHNTFKILVCKEPPGKAVLGQWEARRFQTPRKL